MRKCSCLLYTSSTYRGLGSIDITAAVRSLLFIGKLKDSPTTRVLIHEKSSLAPPGQSLAFSLGDEKGFEWIGAYDITADELLAGTDTAKTESKTAQAQMLILELLANGKRMPRDVYKRQVKPRLMEAEADLDRVLVIDEAKRELTLSDERIEKAITQNGARLIILDPIQAYMGEKTDMNRANEVPWHAVMTRSLTNTWKK